MTNNLSFQNTEIAFENKTDKELKKSYWLFKLFNNNLLVGVGKKIMLAAIQLRLPINEIAKSTVFPQFCGGETLEETMVTAKKLAQYHIKSDLAYSVEAKDREEDFENTEKETHSLIVQSKHNTDIVFVSVKITGFASIDLLEKVQTTKILSEEEKKSYGKIWERLDKICKAAAEYNKIIFVDAEESWLQNPLDEMADAMMKKYNKSKAVVYNTIQLYRTDRLDFLKNSFNKAKQEGYIFGAKLVRGAYMEKERLRAKQMSYPSPIHPDKISTDKDYDAAIAFCINHIDSMALCVATHNETSCSHSVELSRKNHPHIFFGQLYGMSDHLSFNLAKAGYNVAKYIPYGPVKEVMPYLIRRAEENSSIAGQMGRELQLIKKEIERRNNLSPKQVKY